MKGIVFTELLEMVEDKFGIEMVDDMIQQSDLKSEGVYTSIGTYDFFEMQQLLAVLSKKTGISIDDLVYTYGLFFFSVLYKHHPNIFELYHDPLEFLASIENHIHVEVRKMYPDAELPTFEVLLKDDRQIEMIYSSERSMYMFAKALMEKTFEHYNQPVKLTMEKLNEQGTKVYFKLASLNQ